MALLSDIRTICQLASAGCPPASTHAERMERFYRDQARDYDRFRQRLLPNRCALVRRATDMMPNGFRWLDLASGTGSGLEFAGPNVDRASRIVLCDLSPSLCAVAQERVRREGYRNVEVRTADATQCNEGDVPCDLVTVSYALTMIPSWWKVILRALDDLKPGGVIGVVDFFLPDPFERAKPVRCSRLRRNLTRSWFEISNVFLSSEHLPFLREQFVTIEAVEEWLRLPYVPFCVPSYRFLGLKPVTSSQV